jgi:endonuclease III
LQRSRSNFAVDKKAGRRKSSPHSKSDAVKVLGLVRRSISETTALGNISAEQDSTPFKVLISTILSARTRDSVTEEAAARLFSRFTDSKSLAQANRRTVSSLIKPVSFYQVKSKRVIQVSKLIEQRYRGSVPNSIDELLDLPGVGRKTANCVLVYAFRTPAIPVDVHVHRISNRIGLVDTKAPEQTEEALAKLYDRKYWLDVNELFVRFGQMICKPLVPKCGMCNVRSLCNYYKTMDKT